MVANIYSNIPYAKAKDLNATVKAFDVYFNQPLEISVSVLNAMKGFFESKGFDTESAETISVIVIKQSKKDGYNPMVILDTLKGLDSVEISALVSEILNFNRFKTSFLGYAREFIPNDEVKRNIIP